MTSERRVSAQPLDLGGDDLVVPYRTIRSDVIGRLVRLGPLVDTILTRHEYPEPVGRVLGEAIALTAMLGSTLKPDSRLILQTKSDGPIGLLVVNYATPGHVKAYASFDAGRAAEQPDEGALLGAGHLAMTIDPGGDKDRYQGIVGLEGGALSDAALTYFRQSEQLPTFLRLAVARHYTAGAGWHWRAGGLIAQTLAREGREGRRPKSAEDEAEEALVGEDAEHWRRARLLAETIEDHELLDPLLTPERLLYRLFHEEGVRVFRPTRLVARCTCSRERIDHFLRQFGSVGLADMREPDGGVTVTCEFCSTRYRFAPEEIA